MDLYLSQINTIKKVMIMKCFYSLKLRMAMLECLCKQKATDIWKFKKVFFKHYCYSGEFRNKTWIHYNFLTDTDSIWVLVFFNDSFFGLKITKWCYMNLTIQHWKFHEICNSLNKAAFVWQGELWESWFHFLKSLSHIYWHQDENKCLSNPWTSVLHIKVYYISSFLPPLSAFLSCISFSLPSSFLLSFLCE